MNSKIQGLIALLIILAGVGFAVQALARSSGAHQKKLEQYRAELRSMDASITRLDQQIANENAALTHAENFYRAWIPEINKCRDSDMLISEILVNAYALNLVTMKKEVTHDEPVEYRGRMGVRDKIEVSVAGRYDRLVLFLDRIRRHYPFLSVDAIDFSINDANVAMSLEMSNCQLTIPKEDLEEFDPDDSTEVWTQTGDEEDLP